MKRRAKAADLGPMLSSLQDMNRSDLLERYLKLYGADAPNRLSRSMLIGAIAYRLQVNLFGGIKPSVRRDLVNGVSVAKPVTVAGTVLIREWHGQHHTVRIDAQGVEYRGERFQSLTQVARVITGQKRSGPAFFGLRDKPHG
jgi:hypothetical protein